MLKRNSESAIITYCVRGASFFILFFFISACCFFSARVVHAFSDKINVSKHNLSVSGPGPFQSLSETRICIFCHTPHNATPYTPLWNHEMSSQTYTLYPATLLNATLSQPKGPTKLCLSCHDGTIALGAAVSPQGLNLGLPDKLSANFGNDLSTHHPVSFSYNTSLPNAELNPIDQIPPQLVFSGSDELHCTTCHDPHDNTNEKFLVMNNQYSALCTACHSIDGWNASGHATSTDLVNSLILPMDGKTWPNWLTVAEWGCEVCHTPHFAVDLPLLNYTSSDFCLSCHSTVPSPPPHPVTSTDNNKVFTALKQPGAGSIGSKNLKIHTASDTTKPGGVIGCSMSCHGADTDSSAAALPLEGVSLAANTSLGAARTISRPMGGRADIKRQITKMSNHREVPGMTGFGFGRSNGALQANVRNIKCVDCHNPHVANNRQQASAPYASGMLRGVSGVDRTGSEVRSVNYEYEVCFKCHGDYAPDFQFVPRVINTSNKRLAFEMSNPSFHPVTSMGTNLNIPSIPSFFEPTLRTTDFIYCTDCHGDDAGGSRGPHGSSFAPILRDRYETRDNTPESYENYALCYRCHNRTSILNDESFNKTFNRTTTTGGGHSGHLANGAPCSACHDPHGINVSPADSLRTGSHTHLINFDAIIVMPKQGNQYPIFTDLGTFSGSCTLVCHGKLHDNLSY